MSNRSITTTELHDAPNKEALASKTRTMLVEHRWLLAVLALTFLAYAGTLRFEFVSDDDTQIVETQFIKSWQNVPRFFTGHAWSHFYPNSLGNYYRPIALLWLFLNHLLFGLNPLWRHLTTLLAHLIATVMVYVLVDRILKERVTAGFAALVFGLHPVHIEAVAWVSGFTEPLLAILFISSFLFYLRSKSDPNRWRRKWLALSLVFYTLALLTKETAIILPAFVCAYEVIFDARRERSVLTESGLRGFARSARAAVVCVIPYLAVTVVYLLTRAVMLKGLSHPLNKLSPATFLLTWPSVIWFYARQLIWPVGLSGYYDTPYVVKPGFSDFVLPLLAVASIAGALGMAAKRSTKKLRRVIGFAAVLLVLPILPLLNLSVFREAEIVHDRYLYIPSIGFSILVALALARLGLGQSKLFGRPALQVVLVIALTGALGFATASQHIHWASNLVLYHHSLSVAPNNDVAANDLANELSKRGFYDDAIALYQQVLARDPNHWAATYDLGCNYYLQGKHEAALAYLIRGIEMRPAEPKQYLTLAVTLEEMNRPNDAESAIRQAIAIQPQGMNFNYELGDLLKAQGKLRAALDAYKAEAAYNPGNRKAVEHVAEIEAQLAQGDTGN